MSYIPNCRPKYKREAGPFPYIKTEDIPKDEINPYWYGLLQGRDKEFVTGFDFNTGEALNNLFDNLEVYEEELMSLGINVNDIDTEIVNGSYDEDDEFRPCKWYNEYSHRDLCSMNKATRLMLFIKYMINDYVEMERDNLITSLIESMSEEEHEKAMRDANVHKDE